MDRNDWLVILCMALGLGGAACLSVLSANGLL